MTTFLPASPPGDCLCSLSQYQKLFFSNTSSTLPESPDPVPFTTYFMLDLDKRLQAKQQAQCTAQRASISASSDVAGMSGLSNRNQSSYDGYTKEFHGKTGKYARRDGWEGEQEILRIIKEIQEIKNPVMEIKNASDSSLVYRVFQRKNQETWT